MDLFFILACHNRRDSTLRCLETAYASAKDADLEIHVTLYDDGSSDQTAVAVASEFPEVSILGGTGSDYWARSMALAEAHAADVIAREPRSNPCIVWLNDDVVLDSDALQRLCRTAEAHPSSIIVGAMRDSSTGSVTYSGLNRAGVHPLSYVPCEPTEIPQKVEVFNGNLVLVPYAVAQALESVDGNYSHALADIDYGLRAKAKAIDVILAAGTFGTCSRNPPSTAQNIGQDWRKFIGPKGPGNPSSMMRILRIASPRLWPVFFLASYFLWWGRRISHAVKVAYLKLRS